MWNEIENENVINGDTTRPIFRAFITALKIQNIISFSIENNMNARALEMKYIGMRFLENKSDEEKLQLQKKRLRRKIPIMKWR